MTTITRILYPTDFSEASTAVLASVVTLARLFQAEVVLLHVVEPLPTPSEVYFPADTWQALMEENQQEAIAQLDQLAGALKGEGVAVTTRLLVGSVAREILRTAREEGVDLIAMGTHGRTGLSSVVLGSVADKIVCLAPCPVLTARNQALRLEASR